MTIHSNSNSALPFGVKRGFTAVPNAVCDLYVRHPKFTPATERVYRYLLRRYNAEYGYAFPSWNAIMLATNIGSRGTVKTALDSLEYLGLIERDKHVNDGIYDNNIYRFKAPVEDENEFYRRFGAELSPKYQRNETAVESEDITDWL